MSSLRTAVGAGEAEAADGIEGAGERGGAGGKLRMRLPQLWLRA